MATEIFERKGAFFQGLSFGDIFEKSFFIKPTFFFGRKGIILRGLLSGKF